MHIRKTDPLTMKEEEEQMKEDKDKRRSFLKHVLAGAAAVVGSAAHNFHCASAEDSNTAG